MLILSLSPSLWALTLDEALSLAKKTYPLLKAYTQIKERDRFFYKASYDPYFPRLSYDLSYRRAFETSIEAPYQKLWDTQYSSSLNLMYRLFDGGYRHSRKEQALFTFNQAQTDIKITESDLRFMVKEKFYTALAKNKILEIVKESEMIAKRNYELALAKREAGVAMLSDVTQAQVRYTEARIDTIEAKKDLEKAIGELNSLIDWPLDKKTKLEGELKTSWILFSFSMLEDLALGQRPEIARHSLEIKKTKQAIKEQKSNYWPKLDSQLAYFRYDTEPQFEEYEAIVFVSLSYDIFDGLGRYYRVIAQKRAHQAAKEQLSEIKREISLEVHNAYKDLELAFSSYQVALELAREAEVNYEQAFGEYKVGKGDILSLIQADMNLAKSRVGLVQRLLNYNTAMSALEKAISCDLDTI
jgi:outer membrane protein TolC